MANKTLFNSFQNILPVADTVNNAGGVAYNLDDKSALAQFCLTGVFRNTFYTQDKDQLSTVTQLLKKVNDPVFVGQVAVYARKHGFMKDTPACLLAWLASKSSDHSNDVLRAVFPIVIDNGKMLRNFVQMVRSGVFGRKSLGSLPKKLIQKWFRLHDGEYVFKNSIGNDPSMVDVIKLSHPRPNNQEMNALFGYLLGKEYDYKSLPICVREYEEFKKDTSIEVPNIPFQFLASLDIPEKTWMKIAMNGGWHMVRMNLNTFNRHGVFKSKKMVEYIADKLRNVDEIKKSKVFPYQLLAAYQNANDVPMEIKLALQDAMEVAIENVPVFGENVFVLPDVSGSMHSPITGYGRCHTSKMRCIDVAGLFAASILRTTPTAQVLPFAERVKPLVLNPRDSVMSNTQKLANLGGGGTNCSAPLEMILNSNSKVDTIIYVSDCESWMDNPSYRSTSSMDVWKKIKRKNKNAKCICIDVTPNITTQMKENTDVLNIGGFSDQIFNVIDGFVKNDHSTLVGTIEKIRWSE